MTATHATLATPRGPFTVLADQDGAVLASGWTADVDTLRMLIHPSLRPADSGERTELGAITRAVTAYLDGDVTAVDAIAVTQRSGPFLEHAWKVLRTVPAGSPVTYREFAELAGSPAAIRAAANACARNPAALFVPCHRVLRTDGGMGGFRWGTEVKRWLLDHEG